MARHGTALIADFAEVYGLRLTTVVEEWSPVEVVSLIAGLTTTRSRYAAELQGYEAGRSWNDTDFLALDSRNAVEGLRATLVGVVSRKKRDVFREWNDYPGKAVQAAKRTAAKIAGYRKLTSGKGKYEVR